MWINIRIDLGGPEHGTDDYAERTLFMVGALMSNPDFRNGWCQNGRMITKRYNKRKLPPITATITFMPDEEQEAELEAYEMRGRHALR